MNVYLVSTFNKSSYGLVVARDHSEALAQAQVLFGCNTDDRQPVVLLGSLPELESGAGLEITRGQL